ncbi:MAG: sigma-70 family RNA polymerase sigma factor [Planctomycetaceae bacterium]
MPDEVSPGGFSLPQLREMLEAERNYLLAIATQELGLHLSAKCGESDLVQDTFLNATRDLRHFSGRTPDEFRSWLRSILKHSLLNFRRRYLDTAKRETGREVPLGSAFETACVDGKIPSPSRVVMQAELLSSLQAAMLSLPPSYQQVIKLRSMQQLPFDRIARQLNISAEASRKLWCRAVEALQTELLSQNHDISGIQ